MAFPRQEMWVWVTISFSRGSSWPRDWTCISCIFTVADRFFTCWATGEVLGSSQWKTTLSTFSESRGKIHSFPALLGDLGSEVYLCVLERNTETAKMQRRERLSPQVSLPCGLWPQVPLACHLYAPWLFLLTWPPPDLLKGAQSGKSIAKCWKNPFS